MESFKIFSGTASQELAEKITRILKKPLGKMELTRFPDGECRVRLEEEVIGKTVFLLQSLSKSVDEHLFELCLIADSSKRLGAKEIVGIIPWLGYSKQDREFRIGEAVSVEVIGKIISSMGFSKIVIFDLHSSVIKNYFSIPVIELSAKEELFEALKSDFPDLSEVLIISPDRGGKSRADRFAKDYKLPIIYLEKTRDLSTGRVTYQKGSGDLSGKVVVIFDDIINRGGTVIKAALMLKEMGAKIVVVLATHGVLAGEAPKSLQASSVDKIYLTDTILIPQDRQFPKLKIISIARSLAWAIKKKLLQGSKGSTLYKVEP